MPAVGQEALPRLAAPRPLPPAHVRLEAAPRWASAGMGFTVCMRTGFPVSRSSQAVQVVSYPLPPASPTHGHTSVWHRFSYPTLLPPHRPQLPPCTRCGIITRGKVADFAFCIPDIKKPQPTLHFFQGKFSLRPLHYGDSLTHQPHNLIVGLIQSTSISS